MRGAGSRLARLDIGRLRWVLGVFFLSLAIPTAVLVHEAYGQMQWEAFHQHRLLAEELASRIDDRLSRMIESEEGRSFADYAFLVLEGEPASNFLQRSPLASYPVNGSIPGLLAYFQVDSLGAFSTPLLPGGISDDPRTYGISPEEYAARVALGQRVHALLSERQLARGRVAALTDEERSPPAPDLAGVQPASEAADEMSIEVVTQSASSVGEAASEDTQLAFDKLQSLEAALASVSTARENRSLGRVDDLELDATYATQASKRDQPIARLAEALKKREKRKEQAVVPEAQSKLEQEAAASVFTAVPVSTFDTELDPMSFASLDDAHFVIFRKVWREGARFVQGAVIERQPFIEDAIESAFRSATLSRMSDLIVAYQGEVIRALSHQDSDRYLSSSRELSGSLLHRARFSAPFSDLELIFTVTELPLGPGGTIISWAALVLLVVLCGGFAVIYRLGVGQINLQRQQQDFVAAVSHELKTPLTSIRMYGEMLREGWADETRKRTYYDFIFHESERLSRLIANVLALARMTRSDASLDLRDFGVEELLDTTVSKVSSQVERAGFSLDCPRERQATGARVRVDADAFSQVIINLIDNALKFSRDAERKVIELSSREQSDGLVTFSVRDFGPGIPKGQFKKIFRLFYRPASELTRETVGTGIGLALVHQLVTAMGGKVDVVNREPGAEFRVSVPSAAA